MISSQEHALAVARHVLIPAGVPVFAAPPAMVNGAWDSAGGHNGCGYRLPNGWQKTVPSEHWLDASPGSPLAHKAWRPGYALCAVMGHAVDGLDTDPRHGGDVERQRLIDAGFWPTTYGTATTPSGGTHELIRTLGVGSRDDLRPGLDLKAGGTDGSGRGFLFIAPTVRLSKVTGQLAAYAWSTVPDLDDLDEDDDSGAALAEMVHQARGTSTTTTATPTGSVGWPHQGPIADGQRYPKLRAYAGSLRRRDVHLDEALVLLGLRHQECAQPPAARYPMPWSDAEALLRDIYRRYPPDAVPAAIEDITADDLDAIVEQERAFSRSVTEEATRLRVREAAARIVRQERASAQDEPVGETLDAFLAVEDPENTYRIDGLWPTGGRVVLAAQYKAGKSTLGANLVRSLADGEAFLGRHLVAVPPGRVVIIDDELDKRMLRRWLREQGIEHTERVAVLSLRGKVGTFDLLDEECRARWAAKLCDLDAAVVILDCLRPVLDAAGLSEDKDAGRFLVAFDALLAEAGVSEAVVVHHMGHAGERSRGDTRIRDWPDVEWRLVRERNEDGEQETDGRRYFAAYGRDVDAPEALLGYEPARRRLCITGGTRKDTAADGAVPDLLAYLADHHGASQRSIETALLPTHRREAIRKGIRRAIAQGEVITEEGPRSAILHFLTSTAPSAPEVRRQSRDECASAPLGAHAHTDEDEGSAPRRSQHSVPRCPDCPPDAVPTSLLADEDGITRCRRHHFEKRAAS